MAIHFVVAVVIWGLIGFVLDLLLPFQPWLTFLGVLVGTGIGLVLARRRALVARSGDAGDVDG